MSVFAVPGWVRVVSRGTRGSFAACGRDADLKTGVPLASRHCVGLGVSCQAVAEVWRYPSAARSAAGVGCGEGFPSPRKTMARVAERCAPSSRGGWAPHSQPPPDLVRVPSRERCGALPPRATGSGESVKGGTPLSQSVMTNRNLPPRADGAQGSFDSRARSGWESGPPTPTPPAPGSPCGSRRTSEARARSGWESGSPTPTPPAPGSPCGSRRTSEVRREAPGGLWTGPRRNRA